MTENNNGNPIPEEYLPTSSEFFRSYTVVPGFEHREHRVGIFELGIPHDTLKDWIGRLRSITPRFEQGDRYVSQGPDDITKTEQFILKKKYPRGAEIQLRGLLGLQTPITLVLLQEEARIYIPLTNHPDEDPRSVVEQLGPEYWMRLPAKIADYHSLHGKDQGGSRVTTPKKGKQLEIDPEIARNIEDILVHGFDGEATPQQLSAAYDSTFRKQLPPEVKKNLGKIIQEIKDKIDNPPPL